MTTVGIICEYNPFHNGHKKQFDMLRRQLGAKTRIVCLMSGGFVQRGEPALYDKYVRAQAAVLCGANLVLELPVTSAISSAEGFAQGAVSVFDQLGGVDYLCFGSESGDLPAIVHTAEALLSQEFKAALQAQTDKNVSYASARQKALSSLSPDSALLSSPNDILAVEYCKALLLQKSPIQPLIVRRDGSYLAECPDTENPSAMSLRSLNREALKDYVPAEAFSLYQKAPTYRMEYGERAVLYRLRTMNEEDFAALPYGNEGLWRRLMHASREAVSVKDLIERTKSKRYPYTRICRMLLCAYLGITKEKLSVQPDYVRVLSADPDGTALLRELKSKSSIKLVNAGKTPETEEYYALECRCAELYSLFCEPDRQIEATPEQKGRIFLKKM